MTPEKWGQLKELFDRGMDLDPSERVPFAERACGEDETLRQNLLNLLENDAEADPVLSNVQFWAPDDKPGWQADTVVLGRFRITRFIGRGGMGEVYEALDLVLHKKVALKTIRADLAWDPRILARFKQEINLALKVNSPHVCRIYDIFSDSTPFLSMEYLEGETLQHKIREQGPLDEPEVRMMALQLCEALQAAHNAGVVHRDFKSGNVMVRTGRDGSPCAVVTDFGLATVMATPEADTAYGPITKPGAILGTPAYMAPEQFEAAAVTPATDVYALGIVLYEMLTGRTPFQANTPVAAAMERLKHRPDPPSRVVKGLSSNWDTVIARCLEVDMAARPQSGAEVAATLNAPKTGLSLRTRISTLRRIGTLASIVLILCVVLGAFLYRSTSYPPPSGDAQKWYNDGITALREGTYLKAANALQRAVSIDNKFALAHARLADAWAELDFTERAKTEMLQADSLELIRDLPDIDKDYIEAVRATLTNDFAGAITRYERILKALPSEEKAFGWVDLGRAYEKNNQLDAAVEAYATGSKLASQSPACFLRAAMLDSRRGRTNEAKTAFDAAAALYRASSNIEGEGEVAYQQGVAAIHQGRLADARGYIDSALFIAGAIRSPQLQLRALLQLSSLEYRDGHTEAAAADAQHAIELAGDNGIGVFWSTQGLVQLGITFETAGDYAKAERYLKQALEFAKSNHSPRLEAFASVNLASVRERQGRWDEVIPLATVAFNYYREHGFMSHAHSAHILLGRAELAEGEVAKALKTYTAEAALGRKTANAEIISDSEEGLGNVFQAVENYPLALAHYESALEAGKDRDVGFVGYQAFHVAAMLVELGRYDEFEAMLPRAEAGERAEPELAAEIENLRAGAALARLQYASVRDHCFRALRMKTPPPPSTYVQVLYRLGLAQVKLGHTSAGVASCRSALQRAQRDAQPEVASTSLALAEALYASASLPEASLLVRTALGSFEQKAQVESTWRALYLVSRLQKGTGTPGSELSARKAMDILNHLNDNWDSHNSKEYWKRPDVKLAQRELIKLAQGFRGVIE